MFAKNQLWCWEEPHINRSNYALEVWRRVLIFFVPALLSKDFFVKACTSFQIQPFGEEPRNVETCWKAQEYSWSTIVLVQIWNEPVTTASSTVFSSDKTPKLTDIFSGAFPISVEVYCIVQILAMEPWKNWSILVGSGPTAVNLRITREANRNEYFSRVPQYELKNRTKDLSQFQRIYHYDLCVVSGLFSCLGAYLACSLWLRCPLPRISWSSAAIHKHDRMTIALSIFFKQSALERFAHTTNPN